MFLGYETTLPYGHPSRGGEFLFPSFEGVPVGQGGLENVS